VRLGVKSDSKLGRETGGRNGEKGNLHSVVTSVCQEGDNKKSGADQNGVTKIGFFVVGRDGKRVIGAAKGVFAFPPNLNG